MLKCAVHIRMISHFEGFAELNKYHTGIYGLKLIFFIQMGYLELQRYDVKKKVYFILYTCIFLTLNPEMLAGI